ncbi:hypothetical protein OAK91_01745, partial [Planctomycetaceae bacterium]|nr:hypothetical protein [Planctomycetaceae bacterium]
KQLGPVQVLLRVEGHANEPAELALLGYASYAFGTPFGEQTGPPGFLYLHALTATRGEHARWRLKKRIAC